MRKAKDGVYYSKVYTERPDYADFDAPSKFTAIQSIIARRRADEKRMAGQIAGQTDLFKEMGL